MHRRKFMRLAGNGIASEALVASLTQVVNAATPAKASVSKMPKNALMKVGTQNVSADETLRVLAALGVNHVCSSLPSARRDAQWSVEGLMKLRERVESFGIKLEIVPLPLSSIYITKAENPNIMLGKSPERDREIDDLCQMIRNTARAGMPTWKYNLSILGVVRTETTPGRGGADYSTFVYDQAKQDPPLTKAGPVSADAYWERVT